MLVDEPARFHRVRVLDVDERVWRFTRFDDSHVTAIIDHASSRNKTGTARLPNTVENRSKAVPRQFIAGRPLAWARQGRDRRGGWTHRLQNLGG
jgi:hypothetical protein